MFCPNTACCADDLIVVVSSPSLFVLLGLLHHLLTRSITTLASSVGCSIRFDISLWNLACCWHCSFLHGSSSIRSVFFCSHLPSPVAIGLLHRAPSTRCILLLLPLSWLTDSLFPFLSSYAATFRLLFRAPGTRCRLPLLLLSGRFFVSARARPRARWLLLT